MNVADAADDPGQIWPHDAPPGQWRLTSAGAHQWRRAGVDAEWHDLPEGRGPGRFDMAGTRWWPDSFACDPFDDSEPPRLFDPAMSIVASADGWPAFSVGEALRKLEYHPMAPVPRGATRFANGGWPARLVALAPETGELWWWDPAGRRWLSLGLATDDPDARLFGCDDGVLLLARDQLTWLIADHSAAAVVIASGPTGAPLATPVQLGREIIWPSRVEQDMVLWRLHLTERTANLADPQRYTNIPQALQIAGRDPGQKPPAKVGMPARQTNASAWFMASDGALSLGQRGSETTVAQWYPHPSGFQGLCDLALHQRADTGAIEAQLDNGDHVATMTLGRSGTLRPQSGGLLATLGGQSWQGRTTMGSNRGWRSDTPVAGSSGTWLMPVAELSDGVLMLEFPDITKREKLLRGEPCGSHLAQLVTVAGGMQQSLGISFQVQSAAALTVAAHSDGLLITNREDSRQCAVLGTI